MKRAQLLLIALLTVLAAFPLLANRGLPQGSDMDIHYWRTFAYENSLAQGDVLGLWAEPFYHGYGSPIFQYQAPLFYVLAALVGKLPFVDDAARLNLVWLLAIFLAIIGMYGYAVRRWGWQVALVCAAAFVCAPALIFNEPIGRGSYPVNLAWGLVALSLFALDRYASEKRFGWLAALSIALMLWSHNLTAVTGAGVLVAWFIWQAVFFRKQMPYLRQAFTLFILACGISAFFWLPLMMQRGDVHLDQLYAGENLNFKNYFQPLDLLLTPPALLDTRLYIQKERYSLGVLTWMLGVGSLLVVMHLRLKPQAGIAINPSPSPSPLAERGTPFLRQRGLHLATAVQGWGWGLSLITFLRREFEVIFWLLLAILSIFLVLPQSRWIWENIGVMRFFQFPPRFLNVAALGLALGIAPCVAWLQRRWRWSWLVLVALLVAQGWHSTPWKWQPDYSPTATGKAFFDYEMRFGALGTTGTNEFLPVAVDNIPPPTSFVLDSLAARTPTHRINITQYPAGTMEIPLKSSPLEYVFEIHAPELLLLEVMLFDFTGWHGELDGQPMTFRDSTDAGFVRLDIPPGKHIVRLYYALTPIRILAIGISAVCIALVAAWLWWQRTRNLNDERTIASVSLQWDGLNSKTGGLFAGIAFCLLLLGFLAMRPGVAWVESAQDEALIADVQYKLRFGDDIDLLGYDLLHVDAQQSRLALYWHLPPEVDTRLNSFVHVIDAAGNIVGQQDKAGLAGITTLPGWFDTLNYRDVYMLDLPPDLPVGEYRFRVGLWRCADASQPCANVERLPVYQDDALIAEDFVILPDVIRR